MSGARVETVEYRVAMDQRHAHLFDVEALVPTGGGPIDLHLPAWTPGSYLLREFARHLQDLVCDDGEGRVLRVEKIDKATWRVDAAGAARVRARYRVYAWDLTVRTAHLDDTHAFWNGACLFLYADATRELRARVTVDAPSGWRVTVGLDADPGSASAFIAKSYDELVDSPFEVGTHELIEFSAQNRPHRLAVWGRLEVDRGQLTDDIRKIIDAAQAVFSDEVPYPDYTFLLLLAPGGYGGLEHARSTTLLNSPFTFHPRKRYEDFLELVSHEFFHLWNVKRIRPEALGPFDYQREAYTRSLWLMEGLTSYYDRYLLVRAGLLKPGRFLDKLGEDLAKIAATPGRVHQSLEEASFDAWIKFYRPDENSVNSTISYYLKGGVVATLLDLEIRSRTRGAGAGAKTLDDVMRALWRRYREHGRGFADGDAQAIFESASGIELGAFFDRHVRGRGELDAKALLRSVGLEIAPPEPDDAPTLWLGVTTKEDPAGLAVTSALEGGPGQAGGLYAGDTVVAIDGYRATSQLVKDRLASRASGDTVELTVFRRDQLRTVRVTLGEKPPERFELRAAEGATDAERAAYQAWLGAPLSTDEE
jgi:predicted metalloprotease with PDZ domain